MFTSFPRPADLEGAGREMHALIAELFPLPRSITGNGVRQTLRRIGELIPLDFYEVPSGTPVLDWTVPKEWNIRDGWIKNPAGQKIVDFHRSNLHVVGYSVPVRRKISLSELQNHLYSLPDHPDWIPYRTSYYRETWGFCLPHRLRTSLTEGEYEVCIESTLTDGSLTYAECVLPGARSEEILISCHVCHPSLANDNLSGLAVATFLARQIKEAPSRRYTYRFLFVPGTIGSITWLARNEQTISRVRHGLVLACLGDRGGFTYKRTEAGTAEVDRAVALALRDCAAPCRILDFSPYGYDERQYNSPGFRLPVGCLMRSMYGTFPEYHTSADDLNFVQPSALAESLNLVLNVLEILENNRRFRNLAPRGEPQLGRRGLYDHLGGRNDAVQAQLALLWVLNQSDGRRSLLDIAERSGLPFSLIQEAALQLHAHALLEEVGGGEPA